MRARYVPLRAEPAAVERERLDAPRAAVEPAHRARDRAGERERGVAAREPRGEGERRKRSFAERWVVTVGLLLV